MFSEFGVQKSVERIWLRAYHDTVMKQIPSLRVMERALQDRDPSFDGIFFVAVRTTGVFCRPSCPAKTALARNRRYFPSATEALRAGFRPCRRCRPLATNGRPPAWVQQLLQQVDRDRSNRLTDAALRNLGIEPARVRRYFRKNYGMTFQTFCRRRRMGTALLEIGQGVKADHVGWSHGYQSVSGFRDAFRQTFGKPPGHIESTDCIVIDWVESPIGPLVLGAKSDGICLLEFSDPRRLQKQLEQLRNSHGCPVVPGQHKHLDQLKEQLTNYFEGRLTKFQIPISIKGTLFQESVWNGLLQVPYGETQSYAGLAQAIGHPRAVRAVGRANGQNRIAIVIPCHRVINKNGKMGGYGGGLWRKQFLLDLERRVMDKT
jgi:AraC family transcriptional regulator of adaptative response/methylated-DNA-[protein]-cysteine methyltransferase